MTVLISGAGPTGLTLACELARRGVACRVLDKAPGTFPGSRGKGLSPRTQEVFDDLGISEAITASGMPMPSFRIYSGHDVVAERSLLEMLGSDIPSGPGVPYAGFWMVPQWRTDEILLSRLRELGGDVEFGCEVTGFEQDTEGVTVSVSREGLPETRRASYLIGADGGRSTVRKALGVGFAGQTFERERTLIGDVRADGLEGTFCHVLTRGGQVSERFSLWNLPGSQHYQFVASMAADDVPPLTLGAVQRLLVERSGREDIALHDLRWISLYRVNARMVDEFRKGRVILAGDAAHVHSSAGGQGLNTSVQDAYNLGWKLAAVVSGAPAELLDTYEEERMPVAAAVLGLSTDLHRRNFEPFDGPAPQLHQMDITYRGGSLAVDDRAHPGNLGAGDRAPDARLAEGTHLFDVLRGTHFTLLTFCDRTPDIADVRVQQMGPSADYDVEPSTLVLVRPDGYIGVITESENTVRHYLARVR
ncbi:FAD-dependent monooxygenase [Mycobacteroides saopaulense]|uniref:3-(3-hydroxyphenyl)propionate hydroxylase n=1 Tax=Mycobacteroides saopaulense TaxID=1578165 RepID=A0ABX3BYL6_9MYCO|nr:FAD-dependent monooxygenase [Mycobacteroides saopaulense]OHT86972.1 3-(3-hydroxyphenyl)propionate hydroxylase [Mycobacteroides saopaulense]OHU08829.1 3-(3-hydroxyphenyl)propionate hydroxylase [Mycobacteroides saopaulense]